LYKKSPLPSCFRKTSYSDGSAVNPTAPNTLLAPRNSSPPQVAAQAELKPESPADGIPSLPLTAENLVRLNGGASKRPDSCSDASSVITTVTECLVRLGIEDTPQSGLPDIKISEPKLIEEIGSGSFGSVWLAQMEHEGCMIDVAVKKTNYCSFFTAEEEASITEEISHPNIVKTYGYCPSINGIVMELAMGDMLQVFNKLKDLPENDRPAAQKTIIKQMINAYFGIFRNRIAHNDDQLRNFFYKKNGTVILGDFGLAKKISKGYSVGLSVFAAVTEFSAKKLGGQPIPEHDLELVNKIKKISSTERTKSNQRQLRDLFIELWANSQKWDCLSNQELAAKVEPLPEKDAVPD
jgi:hypothetical protein